jgi:hypothetical protein
MWALLLHTWARSLDAAFAVASGWGNYAAAADRPVGQWGRDVRILWALGDVERKPDDGPRGLSETHLSEGLGRVTGWWSHVPVAPSALLLGCGYKFISGVSKIFSAMRTIIKNIKCKLMVKYIL